MSCPTNEPFVIFSHFMTICPLAHTINIAYLFPCKKIEYLIILRTISHCTLFFLYIQEIFHTISCSEIKTSTFPFLANFSDKIWFFQTNLYAASPEGFLLYRTTVPIQQKKSCALILGKPKHNSLLHFTLFIF